MKEDKISGVHVEKTNQRGLCVIAAGMLFFGVLGILLLAIALFFTTSKGQEILKGFV